jgi:thiamine transport system permease protein
VEQDLTVERPLPRPATLRARLVVAAFLICWLVLLLGPVLLVVERALRTGDGYGWDNFAALDDSRAGSVLFVSPAEAIWHSLAFAAAATVIATTVGLLVSLGLARRTQTLRESVWLLPLGVSAVTLGFGMLITFDGPPLPLRGTPALVPIAQALVAIPFVVRAVLPVLRAIRGAMHESAAVLGASPVRTVWSVDLPIVGRALAVAVGFSLAISLGEFGATVFLAPADLPTVPIAIYRFLATPGQANVGQAMALSSILIALTSAAVLLTDRLRVGARYA